jgi:hypothetical protein
MPRFSSTSRRHRSAAEIRKLLSRFHSSPLSQSQFVQTEGLCLATLRRYLKSHRTPTPLISQSNRRKNWMQIGSEKAGPKIAAILSVLETCKRLGVNGREYLLEVLPQLSYRATRPWVEGLLPLEELTLVAALQFESIADGLWEMRTSVGSFDGFVERQSSHVTKNNGRAEYSESFEATALATKDFNWSCVSQLDFSAANFCVWNGATKAGLFRHFSLTQAAALESTPRMCILQLEDPPEGTPYIWGVSISSTGAIRVTPRGEGQPNLSLRFDKVRGEFTGFYFSSTDKIRRTVVGAAILDQTEDLVRAHGWVEHNALPSTKTTAWKLELAQP